MHVRILYAVAVALLATAGFALKSGNDDMAAKVAAASTTPTSASPRSTP
jgi:hypothetical protein